MKRLYPYLASFFALSPAFAAESCIFDRCRPGDTVTTTPVKADWAYHCPTQGLAEYTNFILGVWAMQKEMGGAINPNVDSNATGETARMIAFFRKESGTRSFDEAVAMCRKSRPGIRAKIIANPEGSTVVKLAPADGTQPFWTAPSNLLFVK